MCNTKETKAIKWNAANIHLIIYTGDFCTVSFQDVLLQKGQPDTGCTSRNPVW